MPAFDPAVPLLPARAPSPGLLAGLLDSPHAAATTSAAMTHAPRPTMGKMYDAEEPPAKERWVQARGVCLPATPEGCAERPRTRPTEGFPNARPPAGSERSVRAPASSPPRNHRALSAVGRSSCARRSALAARSISRRSPGPSSSGQWLGSGAYARHRHVEHVAIKLSGSRAPFMS
jgi:hypothetical protein